MTSWRAAALAALVVLGLAYVGNAWSPSSYAFVLRHVGAHDTGLVWGEPRDIRADEYAVVTPLTQASVRNGFARHNATSLYGEDLRINYGLPIRDWGLAFKPTMWLYGVAPPAIAFSFHWFATTALFVAGYAFLFAWLGATPPVALLASLGLYFTGAAQFWWSEKGPIFALFPWVLLPFATRWPLALKAAAFAWAATAWLLTNFYPPVQVSLALVGAALLASLDPSLLRARRLAVVVVAAAAAAGVAALYLWDYLAATAATIYPGERRVAAGSVPARHWLSWLLPGVNFGRDYTPLIDDNVAEMATLGTYYALGVACLLDHGRWRALAADAALRRRVLLLGAALALMVAWMALPLPSWLGAPLAFDRSPPSRMHFAAGLAFTLLLFTLAQAMGLRCTLARVLLFALLVVAGWWQWRWSTADRGLHDLVVLPLVAVAWAVARQRPRHAHAALLGASMLAGAWLFAPYNPVQSAWPIFARPATPVTAALDRLAADNGGIVAVVGLPGATANGLGYRAVNHVLAAPQLAFWRAQFPELDEATSTRVFNRYAHIMPAAEPTPRVARYDAIFVPNDRFVAVGPIVTLAAPPASSRGGGSIDRARIERAALVLWGWAPWTGPPATHALEVVVDAPMSGAPSRGLVPRADVAAHLGRDDAALAGFQLRLPLAPARTTPPGTCVYGRDGEGRRVLLANPPSLPRCAGAPP